MDGALVNPVPVTLCRALGARLVIAINLSADVLSRGIVVPDQMLDEDAGALSEAPTIAKPARRRAVAPDGPAPGLYSIMIDAFNIVQDRITRSRLAGDPPDVTITPRLAPIGLFEFHRAAEAIALGREATERALPHVLDAMAALS
jgi:NTE family protein